ncbi:hypothetical protein PJ985_08810 [Streptomyces sp. ACA25]|uniref:hypothetical protein n=1 Tax=Streptomyces sp. ACA25 TaxID=3022596 RepID=UPI00230802A0|nr:hypothetical protein [Streptomyces sp. ACA25]MDB1087666.1 hypothetical protein [Streptomyces sp. ACA25]
MPSEEIPEQAPDRRRTLLKRMHLPVGKAMAFAAMPSAVMLGMGLTSPLAQAEQGPENPFRSGPCVEMPDVEEEAGAEESAAAGAEDTGPEGAGPDSPEAERAGPGGEADTGGAQERTGEAGAEDTGPPEDPEPASPPAPEPSDPADGEAPPEEAEEPAGEEQTRERHPLDPLGVGDALRDLGDGVRGIFTGGRDSGEAEAGAEEAPQQSDEEPDEESGESREAEGSDGAGDAGEGSAPVEDPAGAGAGAPETERPAAGTPAEDGAADGSAAPGESDGDAAGTGDPAPAEDDPFAPDEDGKVPFPCPETQRVDGEGEQTPVTLADDPWVLEATYLTLRGLKYHGVVNVTTANGSTKQALKFTADKLDIGDLHQMVDTPEGLRYHVQAEAGSNSPFRNGQVTMYTERLEGKLFGLIPIVFDPEHQPPLDIPIAHFTDVHVTQAGQFGGELTIPGMRQYTTRH